MKNIGSIQGKTILLVNTGSIKKRFILQKLKKLGLTIVCLNKEKNWAQPYIDHWVLTEKNSYTEVTNALKTFMAEQPEVHIDGVLTFWEDDVLLTSRIADRFNLIGVPYAVSKKVRNKFLFREFCKEFGLPTPKHTLIKSANDINNLPEDIHFPLVIKPVFGASSAYVVKVENKEEMTNTYNYIRKHMSANVESALADGLDILAEEYIPGDEVDVDIVLQNGKIKFYSISDNYQTKEPFFIETGQATPSALSQKNQNDLISLAEELLEKIGIQNGIIHFEAKSSPTGPVPIEINLRMGGDEVYAFVKGAWGADLIENAVKIALGIYIPIIEKPEMPKKYMVSASFLPDYSGILSRLEVKEELKSYKFLEELHIYKKVADAILVPPEGYEYLGWITVSGYSMLDAQDNLKQALRCVEYDVARFASESSIGKTLRKNSFSHASLTSSILIHAAKIEKFRRIQPEDMLKLHIGIACNLYDENDGVVENELSTVGKNIQGALSQKGYKTTFFNFNDIEKAFKELAASDVDLVVNVCERINNSSLLEPHAASMFDILQIPYTGSNPSTLSLCIDKIRVKKLLAYNKIPTPRWDYAYTVDDDIDENLRYPLIVKPANTDNSIGISNDSVVTDQEGLKAQLKKIIIDLGSPALIEEYIEGDEYDVSILGSEDDDLVVLPLSRSIFKNMSGGDWHIYTNEMKFGQKKIEDYGIVVQRPPKNISKRLESLLTEIALDTYNILDCHDYGRVEIRVDEYDNPYVLELNPNPSINVHDCIPSVAKLSGLEYADFLEKVITMAINRYRNHPPYHHLISNPM